MSKCKNVTEGLYSGKYTYNTIGSEKMKTEMLIKMCSLEQYAIDTLDMKNQNMVYMFEEV